MTTPYIEVLTRGGVMEGTAFPAHQVMYLRLAPEEEPAAALAFATRAGGTHYLWANEVQSVDVQVDRRGYFGFGLAGMFAASVASALDGVLAPWDLSIVMRNGEWLQLYSQRGPAPRAEQLYAVQARCTLGLLREDDGYDEADDSVERALLAEDQLDDLILSLESAVEAVEESDPDGLRSSWIAKALLLTPWDEWLADHVEEEGEPIALFDAARALHSPLTWSNVDDALQLRWVARRLAPRAAARQMEHSVGAPVLRATDLAAANLGRRVADAWSAEEDFIGLLQSADDPAQAWTAARLARIALWASALGAGLDEDDGDELAEALAAGLSRAEEALDVAAHWYGSVLDETAEWILQLQASTELALHEAASWAVAWTGADHARSVDLRLNLAQAALACPQPGASALLTELSAEIGQVLAELGMPVDTHLPDEPAEFCYPR